MYLTVLNILEKRLRSVPFLIEESGEIRINSTNPNDNDESCIVSLTKKFYEYSQDWRK